MTSKKTQETYFIPCALCGKAEAVRVLHSSVQCVWSCHKCLLGHVSAGMDGHAPNCALWLIDNDVSTIRDLYLGPQPKYSSSSRIAIN